MYALTNKRVSWAITTVLTLRIGCKKPTDMTMPVGRACQLQSEATSGSPQATTYTYNDNGKLIKHVAPSSGTTPITYTYDYDAAGNVVPALTQGITATASFTITGSYEYTGGRLTKIVSKSSSNLLASTTDSYSHDGQGRLATYSYSYSSSAQQGGIESYTFTNGLLTGGAIHQNGQSLTVTVDKGRIVGIAYPLNFR